jgi:hypothetical protein
MLIGLDIGTDVVRACVFEGSFGRYSFLRAIEELVPMKTQSDTDQADDRAIDRSLIAKADLERRQASAVRMLLSQVSVDSVITHFPSSKVSVRVLSLPFTDTSKIGPILPGSIEAMVPFDIDDLQIQHRVLAVDERGSQTLVLLTPNQLIEDHLDNLEGLGFNPNHILVDGDVLGCFASNGVQAHLHFWDKDVSCGIYLNGKPLLFRTIRSNYSNRTQLIESIRRTLIYFEDTVQVEIDDVQLSGVGVKEIEDALDSELGVPCTIISLPNNLDPKWALAYALGLKGCGLTKGQEFDLRTGTFAFQGNIERLATLVQYIALLCIVAVVGYSGWFWMQKINLGKEMAKMDDDFVAQIQVTMPDLPSSVMSNPSTVVSLMQEEISVATQKLEKLGSITADEPPTLTLIKEISEGMPPHTKARVDVNEMVISKTSINLKAETDGFQTATEIEQALKQRPRFKQAQKADEKSMRDGIRFSIIIPLEVEQDEEG